LWLTAGLLVALVAGFVGFMTLSQASAQRASGQPAAAPGVPVVTAAHLVAVRTALKADDLQITTMPVDAVPEGALRQVSDATGKVALQDLYPGEPVVEQEIVDPNLVTNNGRNALTLAQNQVLMAFPAEDLMTKAGVLKPGDHVDLYFSLKVPASALASAAGGPAAGANAGVTAAAGEASQSTFNLLQNVSISAVVAGDASASAATGRNAPESPDGLLLALSPQDALVLKYVKDAGGTLDVVLRAPGAEAPENTEPVDMQYLVNRYQLVTPVQFAK
jgi:pilus assembly protein CpaB